MKFRGTKCIELTKTEYDDIKFIQSIETCSKDGIDKVIDYLNESKPFQDMPRYIVKDYAYNLYMTVQNDYKYTKIIS